ncbi:MAG: phospholipase [Candidatus Aenigmarchaeota archaeon]|nr:phospholipase [Candidatus Aenigmarchaeota archaeon]
MPPKNNLVHVMLPLLVIAVVLASGCARRDRPPLPNITENATEFGPGDYSLSMEYVGFTRAYIAHVSSLYDGSRPLPLIIALHGGTGTGGDMIELTQAGLNKLADKEGFAVVYPDGIEGHWNDGRDVSSYRVQREDIDDVGFISALIDDMGRKLKIDSKRVYATGISNGAMMSNRLGCDLAGKITAIAPVAGAMPEKIAPACSPGRPVPVMSINGIDDPQVPWEGGKVVVLGKDLGGVLSPVDTVRLWARNSGCSETPDVSYVADRDPEDGTRVRKEVYTGCQGGSEVVHYVVEGGGHTWPGGWQYLPEGFVGKTNRDIDANQVIWEFFKRHSL